MEQQLSFEIPGLDLHYIGNRAQAEYKGESYFNNATVAIDIKSNVLCIIQYTPSTYLQKRTDTCAADNPWQVYVNAIFIDWNYTGGHIQPTLFDIPSVTKRHKYFTVSGIYGIPSTATKIAVKITDLIDESIIVRVGEKK